MQTESCPMIGIVTPVHNDAEYLTECIASVLAQTYTNWEYTIVNNCSTDASLAIAQGAAAKDRRIRVVDNDRFRNIIQNHNHAVRQISPDAKYCKILFGDDWMYPTCLEELVRVAEANPSVGLVSAYSMNGSAVLWQAPPYPCPKMPGREVCRNRLLGGQYLFGTMTSLLIRADLVRKRFDFFNDQNLHADQEACFEVLRESDFGFVHQVLTFCRPWDNSTNGALGIGYNSIHLGEYVIFLKYGRVFLPEDEYRQREKQITSSYYRKLAHNVLRMRSRRFWKHHSDGLAAFGKKLDIWALLKALPLEIASSLTHPIRSIRRAGAWWSQYIAATFSGNSGSRPHRLP
ncbi:MAG: glycosyltransferase family 2 protein [Bryobacteraceae bacterium]